MPKMTLVGQTYGRWTVLSEAQQRGRHRYWICRCECGTESEVAHGQLRSGRSKSCGCWKKEERKNRVVHGHHRRGKRSTEYRIWDSMRQRCGNPNNMNFHHYGGRGIKVCKRWEKFENFLEDMGKRPAGKTLDRIDNNGNYTPKNCRWVTQKRQLRNTRRTKFLEFNGKTQSMKDWADELGINYKTLSERIRKGWSTERALTT